MTEAANASKKAAVVRREYFIPDQFSAAAILSSFLEAERKSAWQAVVWFVAAQASASLPNCRTISSMASGMLIPQPWLSTNELRRIRRDGGSC